MKRILFIGGMALFCHFSSFAQSNPGTLARPSQPKTTANPVVAPVAPTQTQAEKNAAALANKPQAQNNIKLGLPATATTAEYQAAKEKLLNENPQRYKELFNQQNASSQPAVRNVARSSYNDMPADKKAHIDAHPELFKIVD